MRRIARHLFTLCTVISLLLFVAVCVLWVRGRSGADQAAWTYDRYLPDRSAASNQVHLTSDKRRLSLSINWGHVGPFNGNLVWGYYVNADQSGGRPRFHVGHHLYDPEERLYFHMDNGMSGWGPLRWQIGSRSKAKDGDDFHSVEIGLSHWLVAMLLLVPPAVWMHRYRKARHASRAGLCASCGYDLRATPERCPECGLAVQKI